MGEGVAGTPQAGRTADIAEPTSADLDRTRRSARAAFFMPKKRS
jgi:hypothetical protein